MLYQLSYSRFISFLVGRNYAAKAGLQAEGSGAGTQTGAGP